MEPADVAKQMARTVSEALNWLGLLLCEPTLRQLQLDAGQVLERWEREFATPMRQVGSSLRNTSRTRFMSALDALAGLARQGIASPMQLVAARTAARDALVGFGIPLPEVPPAEATVCCLHGSACPGRSGATGA